MTKFCETPPLGSVAKTSSLSTNSVRRSPLAVDMGSLKLKMKELFPNCWRCFSSGWKSNSVDRSTPRTPEMERKMATTQTETLDPNQEAAMALN